MSSYQVRKTPGDTVWFRHDRFGMFIHWGLYALPARHEWVKNHEQLTDEQYQKYFDHFDPDLYEPREWARLAKQAGMKYAVLTTKHHEGFCLFDSQYTDYKATNTPCGRDLVREYVEAFREAGLRVGFYYSLLDWHHPDFTIDIRHPQRYSSAAEKLNQGRDMHRYAEYMRNQVRELLTNYGKIDIMWFDFSYEKDTLPGSPLKGKGAEDWEAEELIALARSLQPDILIDNRTGLEQDLWTPEQYQPQHWLRHPVTGEYVTWEACQTFSGSWGYHRDESSWKTPEMVLHMLIRTVSLGGNLLMNVGPTARGYIDDRAQNALREIGAWMRLNGRSIYGCTMAEPEFKAPEGTLLTQSEDGARLYVHLIEYPFAVLEMPAFAGKVAYAQFLHDASEVPFTEGRVDHFSEGRTERQDLLILTLPAVKPPMLVPVVELFLKK